METVTVTLDDEQGKALRQVTGQSTTRAAVSVLIRRAAASVPGSTTRRAIARKGTRGDRVFTDSDKLKAHLRTLV